MEQLFNEFMECIPEDHFNQTRAVQVFNELVTHVDDILDLGCGDGRHKEFLSSHCERYIACDIPNSPEAKLCKDKNLDIKFYDGIHLPFDKEQFDVIFMNQVIEHIRSPHLLFPEIARVLKKNGKLIGSVSQLEPFHSYSFYNYTPFGLYSSFKECGLHGLIFRPSIDGLAIIQRSINKYILKRNFHFEDSFWTEESSMNYQINTFLQIKHQTVKQINYAKLLISGQFSFAFYK